MINLFIGKMGKLKKKPLYTGRQKFKAEKKIRASGKKGKLNKELKERFIDFKNRRAAGSINFKNRVISIQILL
jgi:hypothetical protein